MRYGINNTKSLYQKFIMWINIICWIISCIILELVDAARPPFESFLNRIKHMPLRKTWDLNTLQYALYGLVILLILCIISVLLNAIAYYNEKYKFKFTPIFLSLCSLAGIIAYFINF